MLIYRCHEIGREIIQTNVAGVWAYEEQTLLAEFSSGYWIVCGDRSLKNSALIM
jgi:hypothetical protein